MKIIKLITIILLFSTVSQAQQTTTINAGKELRQKQEQSQSIYVLLFEQQCAIEQVQPQDTIGGTSTIKQILLLLPWLHLIYSIGCTSLIARYYHNGWFGLFYTILNLIKLMQNGIFYMFYCEGFEGNQIKGKIFFAILVLVNTWKLSGIIFSGGLSQKQIVSLAAYFSFLAVSMLWLKEYCEIALQFFYIYFHFLQSNYAPNKLSDAQGKRNSTIQLFMFFINILIFSFTTSHTQITLVTMNQRLIFYALSPLNIFAVFFFKNPKELKKGILWLYRKVILKSLGYKLETDTCAICWQEMEIFGGVDNLEDLHGMCCHGLVRVHKNHIFHKRCLLKWSLTKKTCPLDNETIEI